MRQFIANTGCDAPNAPALQSWLDENWAWMNQEVAALSSSDPYWAHLGALLTQMEGLAAGAEHAGVTLQHVYNEIIGGDLHEL